MPQGSVALSFVLGKCKRPRQTVGNCGMPRRSGSSYDAESAESVAQERAKGEGHLVLQSAAEHACGPTCLRAQGGAPCEHERQSAWDAAVLETWREDTLHTDSS
eukprot:3940991-Rhodomonas_salina.1